MPKAGGLACSLRTRSPGARARGMTRRGEFFVLEKFGDLMAKDALKFKPFKMSLYIRNITHILLWAYSATENIIIFLL
jgi:hypothetical protein